MEYWAQVEKIPDQRALDLLSKGVKLKNGLTLPAKARLLEAEPDLPPRNPPIRHHRANIPTAWLSLTLTEGRNRSKG